jgi:ubiquinone/menaquinone biosynthesis C-methylase UbiE
MNNSNLSAEILAYYGQGREQKRLEQGTGQIERLRTQDIILRFGPPAPARVLDVGGGAGIYAFWLAELGYQVHLIDATPLHVEQAAAFQANAAHPLASLELGNACALSHADNSVDMVLLLGPLYHLTEASDRVKAFQEAYRVLKPGGMVFGAAISRFASLLDGLRQNFAADPTFASLIDEDIRNGQHRNPTGKQGYFTTAYFHHPDELLGEINTAGFADAKLLAVEGIGWLTTHFDSLWHDPEHQQHLLAWVKALETEPTLLGASSHLMAIGLKS